MFNSAINYSLTDEVAARVTAEAIRAIRRGDKRVVLGLGYVLSETTYNRVQSRFDFRIRPIRLSLSEMSLRLDLDVEK